MSHHNMKLIVPLLVSCATALSSCRMSDQLAPQATAPQPISITPVKRTGIDGLRLDLEWARSAARSAEREHGITIGDQNTSTPIGDLVTRLEDQLRLAETPARSAASGSSSMPRGLVPAPTPSFDYLDPGDVAGMTTIYASGAPPATRRVIVYAYTSCYKLPSMTIADLSGKTTIRQFDTGSILVQDWPFAADPAPNYTSTTSTWIVSGPALSFSVVTQHFCQLGPRGDWPYVYSRGFAVV